MGAVPELPVPLSRPRRLVGRGFGVVTSSVAPKYVSALAVAALLIVACRAAPAADSQTPGGRLYAANCSTCHGPTGKGLGDYPKLVGVADILGGDYARTVVSQGKNLMPSFATTLTPEQIKDIIDYVATFKG